MVRQGCKKGPLHNADGDYERQASESCQLSQIDKPHSKTHGSEGTKPSTAWDDVNNVPWEFAVFDEAHELKNSRSQMYKTLNGLDCMVR